MNTAKNKILVKMLERLLNSLMNGPSLNCRPHASRQRIDWTQLSKLQDITPEAALAGLLSESRKVEIKVCVAAPSRVTDPWASSAQGLGDEAEDDPGTKAWNEQRACMNKLRTIVEDSKTYEQDTGVHVLTMAILSCRYRPVRSALSHRTRLVESSPRSRLSR